MPQAGGMGSTNLLQLWTPNYFSFSVAHRCVLPPVFAGLVLTPIGVVDVAPNEKCRCIRPAFFQLDKAFKADAVIVSTEPIPLIIRYLGASFGADAAHLE